ncbi:MAG TPA: hypothetical protein ENN51_07135 [candidate division WOR-3 bacterium]|uniref:Uncharacterized protein n=1 Tax=candidate division WOR-3 bacterium TaxID=2052148 RepID=A0A7V0T734_UNCW3|nr:hypothetical protein [candidate division WOR-3 bacterium]
MARVGLVVLSGLFCLLAATNTGCMKCGETIAERTMEKVAEQVTGADEIKLGGVGSRPVDLSDLPGFLQYPGAKATHSAKVSADGGRQGQYYFETADNASKVADWFEKNLAAQGWQEPVKVESGEVIQLHSKSADDKEMASVVIHSEDGKTKIGLITMRETK